MAPVYPGPPCRAGAYRRGWISGDSKAAIAVPTAIAVENLVVFAALVLVADALGVSGGAIASACIVYFWARVVHALAYTFAVPWVRTLAFAVGFFAQAVIAWQVLVR